MPAIRLVASVMLAGLASMASGWSAPPTLSYFVPSAAPAGSTVTLHGADLAAVNQGAIQTNYPWFFSTPFTTTANDSIRFPVPAEFDFRTGLRFAAFVKTPEGVAVTLPGNTPFLTKDPPFSVRNAPISQVEGSLDLASIPEYQMVFVHENAELKLADTVFFKAFFFVKAGATLDYSELNFGIAEMRVFHEPGVTIIGPGPLFTPEGPIVFEEVPTITACDVQLFLRGPTPPLATVSTTQTPEGSVSHFPLKPGYYVGDRVTFTATPDPGATFVDWSPPFSGRPNPFTIEIDGNTEVSASFLTGFEVTVDTGGAGTVTFDPPLPAFPAGQLVTATFHPKPGHQFTGWTGDIVSSDNPLSFTISSPTNLAAHTSPPPSLALAWTWQPPPTPGPAIPTEDFWVDIAVTAEGNIVTAYMPAQSVPDSLSRVAKLIALAPDGSPRWTREIETANFFNSYPTGRRAYLLHPVLDEAENIIIGAGSSIHAFGPDGTSLWARRIKTHVRDAFLYPTSITQSGGIIVPLENRGLDLLNAAGALKAHFPPDDSLSYARTTTVDAPGLLHYPSSGGTMLVLDESLAQIAAPVAIVEYPASQISSFYSHFPSVVGHDGAIYRLERHPDGVTAVHRLPPDRSMPSVVPGTTGAWVPPIVAQNDSLVMPDAEGNLLCLDPESLTPRWSIPGFSPIASPIAAADGSVYAIGADHTNPIIYQIDAEGRVMAHFPEIHDPSAPDPLTQRGLDRSRVDAIPPVTLALAPDGTIYAGARNGTFYAIDGTAPLARSSWPKTYGHADNASRVHRLSPVVTREIEADVSTPGRVVLDFSYEARPAATIEWFHNGVPIAGASTAILALEDIDGSVAGRYVARISNVEGAVETAPFDLQLAFTLTVTPAAHVAVSSSHDSDWVPAGTTVTLTANPSEGFAFVHWTGDVDSTANPLTVTVNSPLTVAPVVQDVAPPVMTLASVEPATTTGIFRLEGSVIDNNVIASATWSLNGSPHIPLPLGEGGAFATPPIELAVGDNRFEVIAIDATGNEASHSHSIRWEPRRTVAVSTGAAREGAIVTTTINLASPGDVGGLTLRLSYDPEFLHIQSTAFGADLANAFTTANLSTPGEVQMSFALTGAALPAGAVRLAEVAFRARSVPEPILVPIDVEVLDAADPVGGTFTDRTGAIAGGVEVLPRRVLGDANSNDRLDVGDAHRLQQLLVGNDVVRTWDIDMNDLNASGTLDSGDLIRVLRAAAAIDPQPTVPAPLIARVLEPLPNLRLEDSHLRLVVDPPSANPGETVAVRVVAGAIDSPLTGAAFTLYYPVDALRLSGSGSHITGPAVPLGTSVLWNVSPNVNDYGAQDGSVSFAASSGYPWPGVEQGDILAEISFIVQPSATAAPVWQVRLAAAEIPADSGYSLLAVPDQHVLVASTLSGFAAWQAGHFSPDQLLDERVSSQTADPDKDGRANVIEFFVGTSPLAADGDSVLTPVVFSDGVDRYLGARFQRDATRAPVEFVVESSISLEAWDDSGIGSLGAAEIIAVEFNPDTATETITVRFPAPLDTQANRFLRLAVRADG